MTLGDKPNLIIKQKDRLYIECQSCDKIKDIGYTIHQAQKNKNGTYTLASTVFYKENDGSYVAFKMCPKCKEYHDIYG